MEKLFNILTILTSVFAVNLDNYVECSNYCNNNYYLRSNEYLLITDSPNRQNINDNQRYQCEKARISAYSLSESKLPAISEHEELNKTVLGENDKKALTINDYDNASANEVIQETFPDMPSDFYYKATSLFSYSERDRIPHIALARVVLISALNNGYVYPIPYLFSSGSSQSFVERLKAENLYSEEINEVSKTLESYNVISTSHQYFDHSERVVAFCLEEDSNNNYSLKKIIAKHRELHKCDEAAKATIQIRNAQSPCLGCQRKWTVGEARIVSNSEAPTIICGARTEGCERYSMPERLNFNYGLRISVEHNSTTYGHKTIQIQRSGLPTPSVSTATTYSYGTAVESSSYLPFAGDVLMSPHLPSRAFPSAY